MKLKTENMLKLIALGFFQIVVPMAALWLSVSLAIFMYRNPKSNELSMIREFSDVITFKKLDTYQK